MLMQYHWPGNVRELQNCMERAVLICEEEAIKTHHLPPTLQTAESSNTQAKLSFTPAVEAVEKEMIIEALKKSNGIRSRAAQELGMTQRIMNYKIDKYGIEPRRFKVKVKKGIPMNNFSFLGAGEIHFGRGAIRRLPELAKRYSRDAVLVTLDPFFSKGSLKADLAKQLKAVGLQPAFFDQTGSRAGPLFGRGRGPPGHR